MRRVGSFRRSRDEAEGAEAGEKGEGFAKWDALGVEAREGRIRRRGRDGEGERRNILFLNSFIPERFYSSTAHIHIYTI